MDSISPPNRPHYPWKQGEILIADELNAAIANAGHGTRVTDWIPGGQPDGVTDLAVYFQAAIDDAADADPADRASAPGLTRLIVPANPLPYVIGTSLYIPSNTHLVIAHGATLKLAPQTNANMFLLCNFAHHVLIELYGTLDGNSSQQYFQLNLDYPATNGNPASISGGISNDRIWGGPARNPPVQGGFCSHVKIIGDRNGLITNFQNQAVGLSGATNCEVSDISLTNSAFHAGSVGVSGWRNFPYDPAAGTPLTFTGTFVAASGIVTLTTNVPHCMVPGEEFITEQLTGTRGFNAATGKLFITLAGTAGNTIVYAATGGGVGTDGSITAGRITNWFYQQATIVSGTYVPATGVITVTTIAPHQLVYGQMISSNITGGTAAAVATGIFQLLDVTDGAGEPPITAAKNVTLRYRTTRTGTTENIVSGVYDAPSGTVTLTTDAPHGLSPGDVVTVSATGSGFLSGLHGEYVCVAGTTGTTIKYAGPPNLVGITISGGTVYGGPTLSITGGTIGVSTKSWNSGFDNCFIDQIRDIGPCIYGGGVACYIRNSEITRNLGSGPYLFSDANSGRCVDCEISGNYIHDNLGAGVGTVNFGTGNIPHTGTRIFNNYITGNRGGAGFGSCDGLECADNYFYKNRAVGLNTYGSVGEITVGPDANRVSITGNTLRDPCLISTTVAGTTLTQVVSGTYNNATGAVSLTTAIPHNLFTNAYFTLSATTGTGAHTSIEGRYIAEASTGPTILNFHAPAGLGTITVTGGQLVPNGFGIVTHGADRLYIADNFIADYQSPPTMLAAIGGTWGIQGVCTGNYYGPRINSGGNFPADMSAGGMQGNNFDVVTGFTNGTTLHQPFSNDSAERFAPLGVQVGYNRSGGRGESNIYVGAGNGNPGGFDFIKVIGISVQAPGSYASGTAIVTLTTRTPHGLVIGSRFNLSLVLGTDSVGFTNGRDIQKLNGNWIATADNAGTSGTTINFVLTQNVAGVPTPYTGLDILTVTGGAINASALDSGVIDTSVGLPVVVSNSGTLGFTTGGSLLAVDGYGNTRLSGALTHGAMQTATLVNAGTVTVNANTSFVLIQNSSSIATGSVVLPGPSPSAFTGSGNELEVRFQSPVGTLSVTAAAGAGVSAPPTTVVSPGSAFSFIQSGSTWLSRLSGASGGVPVGGPFLPLAGGTVTGPVNVTATGTPTSRSVQDRFADVVNVKDFGAVFDGASHPLSAYYATLAAAQAVYPHAVALTDEIDGVAIQAAINLCQSRVSSYSYGGTVMLPCGAGRINQPLTITKQNVSLRSQGAEFMLNSNVARSTPSAPTRLTWTGAPRTAGQFQVNMLTVAPTLVDGRLLTGTNIIGILFYCNQIAGTAGPLIASVRYAVIECAAHEPAGVPYPGASLTVGSQAITVSSTAGLRLGESVVSASLPAGAYVASITDATHFNASVQATATSTETVTIGGEGIRFDVVDALQDSNDTQSLDVRFMGYALAGAANATAPLVMIGGSGVVGSSSGTHWGNTSINWFTDLFCVFNNGHGVVINNSDHNFHRNLNGQKIGAGAGNLLICNGSIDANNGAARFHRFNHIAGGATVFVGTDTGGFNQATVGCVIDFLDRQNAAPYPVIGVGATMRLGADNYTPALAFLGTGTYGSYAISAHIPDSTTLGGNARGINAVDLQAVRSAATQVASGRWSTMSGGNGSTAAGDYAVVAGGQGNTAAGNYATVLGGAVSSASQQFSVASGTGAFADLYAAVAHSGGLLSSGRRAQHVKQMLRAASAANTTPVRLTADGVAASAINVCNLTYSDAAHALSVQLVAIDASAANNYYSWLQPLGLLRRNGAAATTTYVPGTPVVIASGTTAGIMITEAADTTNSGYSLTFTPPTGNTAIWRVVATVEWTRVDGA